PTMAPWDERIAWDVITDQPLRVASAAALPRRAWMLWDRCFELSPDISRQWATALRVELSSGEVVPHRVGFALRALACAFEKTRDESLLSAIESLLAPLETAHSKHGKSADGSPSPSTASLASWLSAAIDCDGAAKRIPTSLAVRLHTLAEHMDDSFCSMPHDLKGRHGFTLSYKGSPESPNTTPLWTASLEQPTTAQVAMMCVSRYENTGDIRYRELIHGAAHAYAGNLPSEDADVWPLTFGQAICLELAAWRSTSRQQYLDSAIKLADTAVQTFWTDSPLPNASSKSDYYESITGSDN